MFQYICDWMQRIAYYLVIVTAILHMIPGEEYRRFVRFFTGLILVLLMAGPLLRLFDGNIDLSGIYDQEKYTAEIERINDYIEQKSGANGLLKEADETTDDSPGGTVENESSEEPADTTSGIHVGEIKIGR